MYSVFCNLSVRLFSLLFPFSFSSGLPPYYCTPWCVFTFLVNKKQQRNGAENIKKKTIRAVSVRIQFDRDSVGCTVNCSMVGSDTGDKMRSGTANSHLHRGEQQGNLGKANKNSMQLRCVLAYSFCLFQTVGGGDRRRKTNRRDGS